MTISIQEMSIRICCLIVCLNRISNFTLFYILLVLFYILDDGETNLSDQGLDAQVANHNERPEEQTQVDR